MTSQNAYSGALGGTWNAFRVPSSSDVIGVMGAANSNFGLIGSHDWSDYRAAVGGIGISQDDFAFYLGSSNMPVLPAPITSLLTKGYEIDAPDSGSFTDSLGGTNSLLNYGSGALTSPIFSGAGVANGSGFITSQTFPYSTLGGYEHEEIYYGGTGTSSAPYWVGDDGFPANAIVGVTSGITAPAWQNWIQCSYWYFSPKIILYTVPGTGATAWVFQNYLVANRSKFRSTAGGPFWWASADIMAWDGPGSIFGFGPDGACTGYIPWNLTVLGRGYAAAGSWIDLGFPGTSVPSGGGAGKMILCIMYETLAAFTTRTGLTFTNYP